MKQEGLQL